MSEVVCYSVSQWNKIIKPHFCCKPKKRIVLYDLCLFDDFELMRDCGY